MRIHSSLKLLYELPAVGLVLLLSFLFLWFAGTLAFSQVSWPGAFLLSFFPAFFVASASGMFFHEQSRKGGFFLIAVFLPFLYFLSFDLGVLKANGLLLGLLAGGLLDWQALHNNRFKLLTGYARAGARLFFLPWASTSLSLSWNLCTRFQVKGWGLSLKAGRKGPWTWGWPCWWCFPCTS
ncbi:TPA: hypothetical protein HA351_03360 [Methanosarcinaceae archaeon]|nr:hypothetical protein [Methanosarcinaceae archaeon]